MKRKLAVAAVVVLLCASFAVADITPGGVVAESREFPRVADLDGNGLSDLIHEKYVLLAQGGGTFVKRQFDFLPANEYAVDWMDVNGDGRPDLVTKDYGAFSPSMLPRGVWAHSIRIQGPSFTFGEPIEIMPIGSPEEAHIGDFNGDGKEDLIYQHILFHGARDYAAEMTIALSRGDGTFERKEPFLIPSHPQWWRSGLRVVMGDMNNDGRKDVVIRTTNDIVFLLNRGNAEFTVASRFLPMNHWGVWEMDLGDVDRDGNLDVVLASTRTVQVLFGDGRGGSNRIASVGLPQQRAPMAPQGFEGQAQSMATASAAPRNLAVGEFIAKGRTEILGATAEGDIFVVAMENGRLREGLTPRVVMPHINPDLFVGSFRERGSSDFLMVDNFIYGFPTQPKPTLFFTNAKPGLALAPAVAAPVRTTRGRAVAPVSSTPLKVSADVRDCTASASIGALETDGVWMGYDSGDDVFDAIVDEEGILWFRYFPKWQKEYGVWGSLRPSPNGGWEGDSTVTPTPCGNQAVRVRVQR